MGGFEADGGQAGKPNDDDYVVSPQHRTKPQPQLHAVGAGRMGLSSTAVHDVY
jgi:hypothetical protein